MSEIPKWDDIDLPSLNQLANRLAYNGSRNGGSLLGFLGDEYLDDCILDLFDTVMWRACTSSPNNEISLDVCVQIICERVIDLTLFLQYFRQQIPGRRRPRTSHKNECSEQCYE